MFTPRRCISFLAQWRLQQVRTGRSFSPEETSSAAGGALSRLGVGEENAPVTMKTSDVMVKALENENIE
jgi:hypothetical protein